MAAPAKRFVGRARRRTAAVEAKGSTTVNSGDMRHALQRPIEAQGRPGQARGSLVPPRHRRRPVGHLKRRLRLFPPRPVVPLGALKPRMPGGDAPHPGADRSLFGCFGLVLGGENPLEIGFRVQSAVGERDSMIQLFPITWHEFVTADGATAVLTQQNSHLNLQRDACIVARSAPCRYFSHVIKSLLRFAARRSASPRQAGPRHAWPRQALEIDKRSVPCRAAPGPAAHRSASPGSALPRIAMPNLAAPRRAP